MASAGNRLLGSDRYCMCIVHVWLPSKPTAPNRAHTHTHTYTHTHRLKTKLEQCTKSQSASLEPGAAIPVDAREFSEEEEEEPIEDGDRRESEESGDSVYGGGDEDSDLGEEFEGEDDEEMIV